LNILKYVIYNGCKYKISFLISVRELIDNEEHGIVNICKPYLQRELCKLYFLLILPTDIEQKHGNKEVNLQTWEVPYFIMYS